MKILPLIVVVALVAAVVGPLRVAVAATADVGSDASLGAGSPGVALQEVDDNDDTRVEVQLVVLAVAAFVVVVIGLTGYALRKRLGLVPPPPGPDAGSSHH